MGVTDLDSRDMCEDGSPDGSSQEGEGGCGTSVLGGTVVQLGGKCGSGEKGGCGAPLRLGPSHSACLRRGINAAYGPRLFEDMPCVVMCLPAILL